MADLVPTNPHTSKRNPFSRAVYDRENFPNIDLALHIGDTSVEIERSEFSQDVSSILNMSIGARAALNEHQRQVAKFGIDGEKEDETTHQAPRDALDEQWDYLLDGSGHVNTSGSFFAAPSYPRMDAYIDTSSPSESVEVLTDISHDFFNSSRAKLLSTPERNRDRPAIVGTRDDDNEVYIDDEFDVATSSFVSQSAAPELKYMSNNLAMDQNTSFQSFGAADLSRISNSDSEVKRSPDNSFQGPHGSTVGSVLGFGTPSRIQDSSFVSTPRRSPPMSNDGAATTKGHSLKFPSGEVFSDQHSNIETSSFARIGHRFSDDEEDTVSVIAAKACMRLMGGKGSPHQIFDSDHYTAIDSTPADFLQAMASITLDAPSPISHIGSNNLGHAENSTHGSSSHRKAGSSAKSSSSSSTSSLTGRKAYRTVVPRRVYMDATSDFPEEQDSFSTPRSSPCGSADHTQRSLLQSFEEEYHISIRDDD